VDQDAVAAALGISVSALWSLSGNVTFPKPTGTDGDGNPTWASGDITAFVALWSAAQSNGWILSVVDYPAADFAMMSTTTVGPWYRPTFKSADSLFDV
jgi:predicted DNA-binding transcriptional regulator AlpA